MRWTMQRRTLIPLLTFFICLGTYLQMNAVNDLQTAPPPQSSTLTYQAPTVMRATTRLVVVDVVVTDSKGQPVANLKADDFAVYEDGKQQKISGFSFQQGAAATPVAGVSTAGRFSNA